MPAATIWPAPLRLAGVRPSGLDAGGDLVGVAAEDGGHAGRGQRAGGGHLRAAACGERDRGLRGEGAGERGRGELADAVPGDDHRPAGISPQAELIGDSDAEGDEQRLGDRGVLDLVRVGGGAEPDQVQIDRARRPGQPLLDPGELQPGVSMPGVCAPWPGASSAITTSTIPYASCGGEEARHSLPNRRFGG